MKRATEKNLRKKSRMLLASMIMSVAVVIPSLKIAWAESTSVIPRAGAQVAVTTDSSSWSTTGNLNVARSGHTATLLLNGKVLVAAGVNRDGTLSSAELYDPDTGTWTATGNLNVARSSHTATLLTNGKVLVAGGVDYARGVDFYGTLSCAELYDPDTGTWATTGDLNTARQLHTATLQPNGKVLAAGGLITFFAEGFQTTNSLEVYDPDAGTWSTISHLVTLRGLHTATLLENGKVLFAGGFDVDEGPPVSTTELYDPATGTGSSIGTLNVGRGQHAATLLASGQALVVGGLISQYSGQGYGFTVTSGAELFDPATGRWSATGSLSTAHGYHTATLLASGKVLVAGGNSSFPRETPTDSAELYDSTTGMWSATNSLSTARYHHTATLLPNGKVLVAGGSSTNGTLNSAELYDPATAAILVPTITGAYVAGKKLFVLGENFDAGGVILLNGEEQKTRNDDANPKTTLIGKKAGKKIHTGDKLQVRNTNGSLSEEFTFIGSYTTIDFPSANISTAWAIDSAGDIIGTYTYGDQHPQIGLPVDQPAYGFLLSRGSFTSIELPGAFLTLPYAINDEGTVVGAYAEKTLDNKSGRSHSFQLSNGDFTSIDLPGASSNSAWGINSAGDIVGVYLAANDTRHGFLLHKGEFTSVDYPGAILTWARGITPSGDVLGLYTAANGTGHGFLLRDGEFTSIDYPGAIFTNALGVNARGDIVGRYDSVDGKQHGYLLSKGHFTSIDFPGASRTVARGINLRGEIVGEYIVSSGGKAHAFLLSRVE